MKANYLNLILFVGILPFVISSPVIMLSKMAEAEKNTFENVKKPEADQLHSQPRIAPPSVDSTTHQLSVDLLSKDIHPHSQVVLSRLNRDVDTSRLLLLPGLKFEDDIPTRYYLKFVRIARSPISSVVPDTNEIGRYRMPESFDKNLKRVSRSALNDLEGAEDGFIVRPLFRYRHEQRKNRNRQGYRNRVAYSVYPRYSGGFGK